MANKEPTKVEKLARELAVELKAEILEKVQPGKIYRSYDKRKFVSLSDNTLTYVNTTNAFDTETDYKIADIVTHAITISDISLRSGCWGMTKNPLGVVNESSKKELHDYFNKVADMLCKRIREAVDDAYETAADRLGISPKEKDDYDSSWDK